MTLAVIILTYNEEKHLPDCLRSVHWAETVIVFDSFSTDRTVEVARAAGAHVIQNPFENYARQRQAALQATSADWVLFVDADERVPPDLAAEIRPVLTRPETGWWIPRHNYLFGKLTRHAGWFPDYQLRLVRRDSARYDLARPVHELVELDGTVGHLTTPLVHLNYETVDEFIVKQKDYARYDAGQLYAAGQRAKPQNFVLQPLRQFWWRFVTLAGWKEGWHGLRLSALMGYFEFEKYRQLSTLSPPSP